MAGKYIAVEGCMLEVVAPATGTVQITSSPSTRSKVEGKGIYRGPLQIAVSNVQQPPDGTATPGTVPSAAIQPTAQRDSVDSLLVMRVGDRIDGLVAADAMRPGGSGSPEPSPITFSVEIKDAGQTRTKGE